MQVFYIKEVTQFVQRLSKQDWARLRRTRKLFEDYGFQIGPKYIKKITTTIWELRAGNVRLFICMKEGIAFGIHIIFKKRQKLHSKDIQLAIKRCKAI